MTEVICPSCGARREATAVPCPTCGYKKIPGFRKKVLQFAFLFAILGILWLLFLTKGMWSS